jgi:FemAB-related protein (PEP-CTERM system-associated)
MSTTTLERESREGKATLQIERLESGNAADSAAWDRFVSETPGGTVFHMTPWRRVVERVFPQKPHYLRAVEGGKIRAVLPLFEMRAVYGGLLGAPDARAALVAEARRLGESRGAKHVEFRHLQDPEPGLAPKSLYQTYYKEMDPDPEVNMKAIPRKQRRMVRQGIKAGLAVRRDWEPLDRFYDIYTRNRLHLGSPPFPRQLFHAVRDEFGDEAELLSVWKDDRLVAGVITLFQGGRVMPYYGAALPDAFKLSANDFMYWELMSDSCTKGFRIFDFGRSREGSGSSNFKRHWGFEGRTLSYQYLLFGNSDVPNISPSSPKLQMFIKAWKKLPLGVTRLVGPQLTRWLPLD